MFLRQLTIKGFKSFADPATLALEPGVTVVVGPNGSGKSNVVDAIAWVLGAQAPSAVRSQKMDDVIFAGTARRPALGRAEVTLTLDNSSKVLPVEFTEVTLQRTLFRTGESEYAINGAPCRLLDMQELLSDAGVGRQQHVIVSQGQIDAVLNARPEDRRAIIEEAAGVLKFRKRKEKAERRLEATEGSLARVQDLLREVRRQLRPLERQAEAARRHGELTAELRAVRIHLAGREIGGLRSRAASVAAELVRHTDDESARRRQLAQLDTAVMAAEAELGALGGFDLGDALVRAEQLRERARGLEAVLAERRRSLERHHRQLLDTGLVATLEADAAAVADELAAMELRAAALAPEAEEVAAAEEALAAERAAIDGARPDPSVVTAAAAAAEARSERRALLAAVERGEAERERVESRRRASVERFERMVADLSAAVDAVAAADTELEARATALAGAERRRRAAEAAAEVAGRGRRDAEAERAGWQGRADALAEALDQARSRAGAERLAEVEGVLGALLELVEVDPGWEQVLAAAAGEALTAMVVDGADSARRALGALADADTGGAVLPVPAEGEGAARAAVGGPEVASGVPHEALGHVRVDRRPEVTQRSGAGAGEPVRRHVRADDPGVAALLDRLLAGVVAVPGGWAEALDLAAGHPELTVVTMAGDRFGPGTWRVGAPGAATTRVALDEARARAATAADAAQAAVAAADAAEAELVAARAAEAGARRQHGEATAALSVARDHHRRLTAELPGAQAEVEESTAHGRELAERAGVDRRRLTELDAELPALEQAEAAEHDAARERAAHRTRLDERARAVAALRRDLEVRAAGLEERRHLLQARQADLEHRLAADVAARAAAAERRATTERAAAAVDRLGTLVADQAAVLDIELADLAERRRRQSEAARAVATELERLRHERAGAERQLEQVRERQRRTELERAEIALRLEAAVEGARRDLDVDPEAAIAAACPPLPEGTSPAARARELERELRLLGPVNPLALDEHQALLERHQFLESQLDDVKASRRELLRVIRAIDTEIQQTFAAAFADVSGHFGHLFATLFPGGQGRLVLTQPDELLVTGIEVEAKPSGKNVKKLSLLSGGERSLTALAFLFAVFRARPSPFYVMDEVEAALDDVNLHRFLGLVGEFRAEAQLIIVTHQKRTMEAADCLFGVTMAPGGSSQVVSERLRASA